MDYAEEALEAPLSGGASLSGAPPQEEQRDVRHAYPSEAQTSSQSGAPHALSISGAREPAFVGGLSVGPPGPPLTGFPLEPGLHPEGGGHSRSCFICLEGPRRGRRGGPPKLLHPCCSQCYAVVHEKCWTAYRRRQRLATFRARLLGHRAPDVAKCSICRTGRGGLLSDHGSSAPPQPIGEGASALQEQLLATLGRLLMDDGDVAGHPTCSGLCICANALVLLAVFLVGCLVVMVTEFQGVTVFLVTLFLYYHFVLFQLVYLAARQRRVLAELPLITPHRSSILPALCACSEALASLPPAPAPPTGEEPSPVPPMDPPHQGPPSPQLSSSAPTEEGGSTSSRPRGSAPDSGGSAPAGSRRAQGETARNPSDAQQQGLQSRWLSFFRWGGVGSAGVMATTAAAPFLPDAALVVEMQVLHSGPVHS
ncbi:hypothetical protein ACSSS7_001499 [Eimeria intestinalis]